MIDLFFTVSIPMIMIIGSLFGNTRKQDEHIKNNNTKNKKA